MKLVKNGKVTKLMPIRLTVKKVLKDINQDAHKFKNIIFIARNQDGTITYGHSAGMKDTERLWLARQNLKEIEDISLW